jgi:hypothetical protein
MDMKFTGVSVCTIGPAIGHDIQIDATTIAQIAQLGNDCSPIKVTQDHDHSVANIIGSMSNFFVDGEQVKADFEVIEEHPLAGYYEKLISIFPDSIGFSIDSIGVPEIQGEVKLCRLEQLFAVGLVSEPAANPNGVYSSARKIKTTRATKKKEVKAAQENESEEIAEPIDAPSDSSLPETAEVDSYLKDIMAEPTPTPSVEEQIASAVAPILATIQALSDKMDAFTAAESTEEMDASEDAEMSKKLDSVLSELSVLRAATRGTSPVETENGQGDLVAQYSALTSDKDRLAFYKKHPQLRTTLKPAQQH